jgi:hypothetical protein
MGATPALRAVQSAVNVWCSMSVSFQENARVPLQKPICRKRRTSHNRGKTAPTKIAAYA